MNDSRVLRPGAGSDADSPVDKVHQRSLAFSRLAPRIFLRAWIVFGVMAVLLRFKE